MTKDKKKKKRPEDFKDALELLRIIGYLHDGLKIKNDKEQCLTRNKVKTTNENLHHPSSPCRKVP